MAARGANLTPLAALGAVSAPIPILDLPIWSVPLEIRRPTENLRPEPEEESS